ncbi:MAG: CHAT domain-containing protein [Betaproteobacteria bacterium]
MPLVTFRAFFFFLGLFALSAYAAEDNEDFLAGDSKATSEFEKQIAATPPSADTPQELCIFLHKRGIANLRLGHYDSAIEDLKQALSMKQPATPDLWCDHWRLQGHLYGALYSSGDWLVLNDYAQSVSDEYLNTNKWQYFYTQFWLVDANVFLGKLRVAEQAFQRASEALPALRQHKAWRIFGTNALGQHSSYAAWMQELRGNYVESERFRRQALNYTQEFLDFARANRSPDHQDIRNSTSALINRKRLLAGILTTQGKVGEAEILARQALQETLATSGRNTISTARVIAMLGNIKLQQGQIADALRLRELALSAQENSGARSYSTFLADMRAEIGFLLGVQNRWSEALKVFEQRDLGLRGNSAQFAKTGSSNLNWAMALLKNQRTDEAEKMLRTIINFNLRKPFVNPLYLAYLRGYLAIALLASGKNQEALAEFREAFPVLVRQAETDNASENGGFVRQYRLRLIAQGYLDLLSRLNTDKSAPQGFDPVVVAFRVAEVARGSSVQQAIASSAARANLPDTALADLARREQDTANQISALNKLLIRLASAAESQRLDKTITDIRSDISRLETGHTALRRELAERYPAYADLIAPQAPTPADIQKVLQKDEAAIAIYVAEHKTYVWTITATRVAFRAVELSRQKIDSQVAALRLSFDLSSEKMRPFDSTAARSLYAALLAPDEALWADAKLLNVIPHGSLGQLPFAVLMTSDSPAKNLSEQAWLLKKVAIAQQPSAGTLISLRAQRRAESPRRLPFVGFGDPLFIAQAPDKAAGTRSVRNLTLGVERDELIEKIIKSSTSRTSEQLPDLDASALLRSFARIPPLPDTAEELNEIGKMLGANAKNDIFLSQRATEKNVKTTDLSAYRVVAFATHGLVPGDLRGLDQPSLAMANPSLTGDQDNDGFLTLSEVLGIKLNADWVVLSACNTASGDGKSDEAVSGLGRAFFFAGTRRLLVSYWPVETVSARLLTTGVFKRQLQQPDESKAEALRYSMLKLMNQSKEYSHPAYWAPFGLIGDAGW